MRPYPERPRVRSRTEPDVNYRDHGSTRATASGMYDGLITEHARANDVRPDLVRAVVQVESAYNPYARSPKGAQGLMQLMPATAQQFGVKNAYNPEENVRAGVAYLRQLLDRYENNEELALAAYNAGPAPSTSTARLSRRTRRRRITSPRSRPDHGTADRAARATASTRSPRSSTAARSCDTRTSAPLSGTYDVIGR